MTSSWDYREVISATIYVAFFVKFSGSSFLDLCIYNPHDSVKWAQNLSRNHSFYYFSLLRGSLQLLRHTPTYITLPHPCWPLNPDVCHSRWWQSEMVLPTRGHSSDKHLSLPSCFFSSVCVCVCLFLSLSLPLWPLQPVAMWPIDPWLDWPLTAIKARSYFTMTATGQCTTWICLKYFYKDKKRG